MKRFKCSDGIGIVYCVWGEDEVKPTVVLHHGFAASAAANWEAPGIVAKLTTAGRRVLALDARGHGESDKPHDAQFYGEGRMARDLCELLDSLELPEVDLVGYSMGAIVSLIAATRQPRFRRLVIGGVGQGIVECGGVDSRLVSNTGIVEALKAETPSSIKDPTAAAFRAFADSTGADRLALAAQASALHASPIPLATIAVPTLVLAGDADPLATRPERLAAAIPGARLQLVSGDHLQAVADPLFASAMIEFLS